jgi:hypothetical protein
MSVAAGEGAGELSMVFGWQTAQMTGVQALQNMPLLDYEDVWHLTNAYPALQWEDVDHIPLNAPAEGFNLPASIVLNQNYPNPFNYLTNIMFLLPGSTFVVLEVFTIQGTRIATLIEGTLPAGVHTVRFDASSIGSGVYLYRIKAGDYTDVKKMILIK